MPASSPILSGLSPKRYTLRSVITHRYIGPCIAPVRRCTDHHKWYPYAEYSHSLDPKRTFKTLEKCLRPLTPLCLDRLRELGCFGQAR